MKPVNAKCVQNAESLGWARIVFFLSVLLSFPMEHFGAHWMDFREILFRIILLKYAEKIQG